MKIFVYNLIARSRSKQIFDWLSNEWANMLIVWTMEHVHAFQRIQTREKNMPVYTFTPCAVFCIKFVNALMTNMENGNFFVKCDLNWRFKRNDGSIVYFLSSRPPIVSKNTGFFFMNNESFEWFDQFLISSLW